MKNFFLGIFTGVFICFLVGFVFYKKFKSIQNESIKDTIENSTYNFPQMEEMSFNKDSLFTFSYNEQNTLLSLPKTKKVLIINFWATWCKPCIEEMPYLDSLKNYYNNNDDIEFVCLTDEPAEKVKIFKEKNTYTLPFASYNKKQVLPKEMVIESLPTTLLFNFESNKFYKHEGSLNWNSQGAKNFINKQLNNK